MPNDDTKNNFHSFDREPPTGNQQHPDTTEHADLNHRIESDTHDEPRREEPVVSSKPASVAPAPTLATSTAAATDELSHPGPGLMVLQWLVYALWGWTVLALSGLIVLVVTQLLKQNESGYGYGYGYSDGISYLLAAVIVLFIISLACDLFYAKAERKHAKTTGSNVIMIIHAVLFSLIGIGALISSVFGAVQLMIGDTNDSSGAISTIISGGVIFLLYAATLLRTLRPLWLKSVVKIYWLLMAAAIIISVILGIMGPAQQARIKAQDGVLERALPAVAEAVNQYANEKGQLPKDLQSVEVESLFGNDDDYKEVIDKGLIVYKPGEKLATTGSLKTTELQGMGVDQLGGTEQSIYHYQLCVTYKASNGSGSSYGNDRMLSSEQRYDTTVDTYSHKAGYKCYDVQTDYQY